MLVRALWVEGLSGLTRFEARSLGRVVRVGGPPRGRTALADALALALGSFDRGDVARVLHRLGFGHEVRVVGAELSGTLNSARLAAAEVDVPIRLVDTGIASFGHASGVHYQNLAELEDYLGTVESGKLPLGRGFVPTDHQHLVREMILLLKRGYLDAGYFRDKFGVEIAAPPTLSPERSATATINTTPGGKQNDGTSRFGNACGL